ncbi:PilX N-terminal domain-containing pilus assembly protein, partial [Roseateles sp. P5_E11]
MKQLPRLRHARSQHGAATLVVVMVLFLVMALLAAYANRSLMFEQRISGSYYRASMAQEMSEAGVEWSLAMLNGTAIDGSCTAVATGGTRFVNQYLNVSAADRATTTQVTSGARQLAADCSYDGTNLVCRCPQPNARVAQPTTALAGALIPSFGVALGTDTKLHYGNFQVTSYGCTDSSVDNCAGATATAEFRSQTAAAASLQYVSIGFIGAVPSSPASPLTVKGTLTTSGVGGLGLHNADPRSSGLLVVSGGLAPSLIDARMDTVPGTPPDQARSFTDSYLSTLTNSEDDNKTFFRNFMGMVPSRYKNHPAARSVTCSGNCGP